MLTYVWAYLAGTLTLINPCVLPLLPIIIAAAFQNSRVGPLMLAAGLTVSFTVIGVGVSAFGHLAGINDEVINRIAAVMLILFGVVLLVPRAQAVLSNMASPLASRANAGIANAGLANAGNDSANGGGVAGQFLVGVLLGAVWSPCIGPTLGGAISLAATGEGLGQATFTMLAFGIGVSTVLMALAYGSRKALAGRRELLMKCMPWAKPIMGAALLVVGLLIFFHIDRMVESWLLDVMPIWLEDLSTSI